MGRRKRRATERCQLLFWSLFRKSIHPSADEQQRSSVSHGSPALGISTTAGSLGTGLGHGLGSDSEPPTESFAGAELSWEASQTVTHPAKGLVA